VVSGINVVLFRRPHRPLAMSLRTSAIGTSASTIHAASRTALFNAAPDSVGPCGDLAALLRQDPTDRLDRLTGFAALVDEHRRSMVSGVEFPREEKSGPVKNFHVVPKALDLGLVLLYLARLLARGPPALTGVDLGLHVLAARRLRYNAVALGDLLGRRSRIRVFTGMVSSICWRHGSFTLGSIFFGMAYVLPTQKDAALNLARFRLLRLGFTPGFFQCGRSTICRPME
jgi:hypothetical protein